MAKARWCWVATEIKEGLRLKLCIGNLDFLSRPGRVFKSMKAVENFTSSLTDSEGKIVFVLLKDSRFPIK